MATVLAVQMLLEWLGERKGERSLMEASRTVETAVETVLKEGKFLTYDLGGKAKSSQVGDALAETVRRLAGSEG